MNFRSLNITKNLFIKESESKISKQKKSYLNK